MMFIFPNRKQCIFEPNNRCFEFFVRKDTAFCEAIKERLFTANIPLENAIDKIAKLETKENTPEARSKPNCKNFAIDFRTVLSIRLRLF